MRGQAEVFSDFRAGVNLLGDPYGLDKIQARDCRNVTSNYLGALSKRNGFETVAEPTYPIHSLSVFNGASDVLVAVGDNGSSTDIYKITLAGTVTSIKAGTVTADKKWSFIQAPRSNTVGTPTEGPLYMMNGTDTPRQWIGSGNVANWTASTSGTLPNGKYLSYFNNRVFVAGVASDPSVLYWSGIGDAGDWASPSGGYTTFDPDDGEPITGLGVVGDYLLVFKPRKTYVVIDTDYGAYRRISSEIGCMAHRSIVETDSGTIFLSNDKQLMITDGSSINMLSSDVDSLLKSIPGGVVDEAAATYYNSSYYISIPESSTNSIIVEFDTRFSSWWLHEVQVDSTTTTGITDWAVANPTTTSDLYGAGADTSNPLVFQAFKGGVYTDNTEVYPAYWVTQWHTFGMPHIRKIFRQLRADAKGDFTTSMATSFAESFNTLEDLIWEIADNPSEVLFGGSGTFGGSGIFGGLVNVQEHRYYTPGTARAFSLKFLSESTGSWDLYSYTMAMGARRD